MGSRKDNGAETPGERIFGRIDTNWFGLFTEEMWRRKEDALSLFVPKNSDTGSDTRKKEKIPGTRTSHSGPNIHDDADVDDEVNDDIDVDDKDNVGHTRPNSSLLCLCMKYQLLKASV